MPYAPKDLRWNGWGRVDTSYDLKGQDDAVWRFIATTLGEEHLPETPAPNLDDTHVPKTRLSDADLDALARLAEVERSARERARHSYGRSYADLVRLRSGTLPLACDAVLLPTSSEEVAAILAFCASEGIAVVPFGGGSSVVGGVEARSESHRAVVSLDTTRLAGIRSYDEAARLATFGAGTWGPDLEGALAVHQKTLGHYPQSFEFSTLGGWIAARGAGQQSNRYGTANKWLAAARVVTPKGELRTLPFPQSAAGPSLNELLCGSEGTLGVITEATVRLHELPEAQRIRTYLFRDFPSGAAAIRRVVQGGLSVAMMRLSDADETYFYGTLKSLTKPPGALTRIGEKALGLAGYVPGEGFGEGRCALMLGFEGSEASVDFAGQQAAKLCRAEGGVPIGGGAGDAWRESRFSTPYLRDPMLDRGIGIDTLETSTHWSNVVPLWERVRAAIRDALGRCAILAHISHSYSSGCSLYFTFFFRRDDKDPMGQWQRVKHAASEAIALGGGTISHHHGVGVDHAPWMKQESGALGLELLKGAQGSLDPTGIMNPGKLVGP